MYDCSGWGKYADYSDYAGFVSGIPVTMDLCQAGNVHLGGGCDVETSILSGSRDLLGRHGCHGVNHRLSDVLPEVPSHGYSVTATSGLRRLLCPPRTQKSILPPYVIEPPDVLLIEAIHAVPKQPYKFQPFDTIAIQVVGTPAEAPIAGSCVIAGDGSVNLGAHYGSVYLSGKTASEAKDTLAKHFRRP